MVSAPGAEGFINGKRDGIILNFLIQGVMIMITKKNAEDIQVQNEINVFLFFNMSHENDIS